MTLPLSLYMKSNRSPKAAASLTSLILLSAPWFRRLYELFARTHQLLAIALPFLIWQHLTPSANVYFFIFLGSFPVALLIQLGILFYNNAIGRSTEGRNEPRAAEESNVGEKADAIEGKARIVNLTSVVQERLNSESDKKGLDKIDLHRNIIQIVLELARPIRVKEGQYIGLWIPAVSTFSCLQVHPFMVTSWSDGYSKRLRVLVEPRRGWTEKLMNYTVKRGSTPCRTLFTGPYGVSVPTQKYGIVLLVASGLGIVAHMSYLTKLIHDYNARRTRTRRICLIWVVKTPGTSIAYLWKCLCLQHRLGIHLEGHLKRSPGRGYIGRRPGKVVCTASG